MCKCAKQSYKLVYNTNGILTLGDCCSDHLACC